MADSILQYTSFSTLNEEGKDAVRRLFDENYQFGATPAWDILDLARQRQALAVSVSIYDKKLSQVNPATFGYLNPDEQERLLQELLFTFYILAAQFHLDEVEHRRQTIFDQSEQIKYCAKLIHRLRIVQNNAAHAADLLLMIDDSEKYLAFLGLTIIAPFITEKMSEFTTGKTVVIKNWMGDVNERRLYWVWGGGLLASAIEMLPDTLAYKERAQYAISAPSIVTGNMSWLLYYARFGINLGLLIKHWYAGSWMSQEEGSIPPSERFQTQWDLRKFSLLNDSIWGVANMVCYFWLTGGGLAGYYGNVVTAGLLLMDVCLNTWRFMEETTQHNENMKRFEQDTATLKEKIAQALGAEKASLEKELKELEKNQKIYEFDWKYKKYATINDLAYSVGLLAAFCIVACFFCQPGVFLPATELLMGVVGAALCFTANLIYAAVAGWLEIVKAKETKELSTTDCKLLLADFNARSETLTDFEKRVMFLELKQLGSVSDHQAQMIEYQKMKVLRGVLVDTLIPPLFFVSFVLMPLGFGLALFSAGITLAYVASQLIENLIPDAVKVPEFDEEEYKKFLINPKLDHFIQRQDTLMENGFFALKVIEPNNNGGGFGPGI